jgi:4-hydroxy-tetrahydrodipicolinate synthase
MAAKSRKSDELHGVIVPIITPVDGNDCVDEQAFRKLIRYLIAAEVNGIFVGGSAGEGPLLTNSQWQRMVEIAFDEAKDSVFLLVGVNDTSTKRVIEKIKLVEKIGYKHVVITPIYYMLTHSKDEHLRFFGECKEASPKMDVIAYNIPQNVRGEIAVETLCEMAQRKWIKYCKESSGKVEYFRKLVSEGAAAGLKVFEGDELTMVDGLRAGACGIVPVCANCEPKTFVEIYRAASSKDWDAVQKTHNRVLSLRDKLVVAGPFWLTGIKYGVSVLGIGAGKPVSPLPQLSKKQEKVIAEFIKA